MQPCRFNYVWCQVRTDLFNDVWTGENDKMQQSKRFDTTADHNEYCIGSWIGAMSSIAHLFDIKICHYWIIKSIQCKRNRLYIWLKFCICICIWTHSMAVIMLEVALKLLFSVLERHLQGLIVNLSAIWLCQMKMKHWHFFDQCQNKSTSKPSH